MNKSDMIEAVHCPVCRESKYDVLQPPAYPDDLSADELLKFYSSSSDRMLMDQLVSCQKCSLVYLNPRIKDDIILTSYSDAVDPRFVRQNDLRIKTFSKQFKKVARDLGIQDPSQTRVLDIGCAGGAFPKAAADLGFQVVGVEPSRWMCEFARKEYGLDIRAGMLLDQKFADQSFDIVTLWDVIEHLTDPSAVLKEIRRILKPDGKLVVNYPDYASLARMAFGKRWPFFLSVHLIYFTPGTLKSFLKQAGFDAGQAKPYWQTLELGYVFERASQYFGVFKIAEKLTKSVGLGAVPLTYNIGQSLMIASKCPDSR